MEAPENKRGDLRSIGVFDSGLGGLTVMQQLMCTLPYEPIVYFGDTARVPYGGKSPDTIVRYSIENSLFLIGKEVKVIVVACNTATSHALDKLREFFDLPILGVIDPGAERAVEITRNGTIAVLGTRGTIESQAYQKAIALRAPAARVIPIACPLFVPFIEEGCVDHPAVRLVVQEYLRPVKESGADTLLLGCTHYPLLQKLIREEVGNHVAIVDSASCCARKVSALIDTHGFASRTISPPLHRYYVSDDPQKFQALGSTFLGMRIPHVNCEFR